MLAVDALDLSVAHGEFLGLLGSNGAGERTTINMLTTLLPPTAGTARVVGFDVGRERIVKNSWSNCWGDEGYIYVAWQSVIDWTSDASVLLGVL